MNSYYKNMPERFREAVEVIMEYCQNEDCDLDCRVCPYTLGEIRSGDVIHHCDNCKHYGEDLHGANCRFCENMEHWEEKEIETSTIRLDEKAYDDFTNFISDVVIPKFIHIADEHNYDRDDFINFAVNIISTMANVATFKDYKEV